MKENLSYQTYFNLVSETYLSSCYKGIQGFFKRKELKKICGLFEEYEDLSRPIQVLDVGCGAGYYSLELKRRFPNLNITGVDASKNMIEIYRENGFIGHCSSLQDFSLKVEKNYQSILLLGVLEFNKNLELELKSFTKICQKHCRVYVIFPSLNYMTLLYFFYHKIRNCIYYYSNKHYIYLFEKLGFKLIDQGKSSPISGYLLFES